ncbi:L-Ala-D/L-Glu epimerase [Hartmannibacter diazotrophicus]|uniref:Dipeptide epimerase n=1 Tax=Hartmannibacter diazotrophicus TaxID=1482074 RepID=A0A2C9D7H3_9HYPH|nr:N-acetyl-D-Glu racemase DgcA [Hartmannibacter diazotrophicus]SON56257.1 L-Ala-D/L-Glu epimerase [Hartmannibacter diazotrophicus]
MSQTLTVTDERWPIAGRFTISRGSKTEAHVVVATVRDENGLAGRGECVPYTRYGETVDGVMAEITAMTTDVGAVLTRADLQERMKPGAARNALDCALFALEARQKGLTAAELAGLPPLQPVTTAFTLSLDTPENMEAAARVNAARPLLKIKLGGGAEDEERLAAVRIGAPDAALIIDANEGWTPDIFESRMRACAHHRVALVEQPLPESDDAALADLPHLVPVCADESAHIATNIPRLAKLYDAVNIKLDKTGGITEALKMASAAENAGLAIMVGCMVATSLAMAPALLLAAKAKFVDLDGPLLLARDREPGLVFEGSIIRPPQATVWA